MDYSVYLTLKCARDLYWAKVTLTDADFVVSHKKARIRSELDEKMSEDMRNNNASLQSEFYLHIQCVLYVCFVPKA